MYKKTKMKMTIVTIIKVMMTIVTMMMMKMRIVARISEKSPQSWTWPMPVSGRGKGVIREIVTQERFSALLK